MVSEVLAQEMPQEMLMLLLFAGTAIILPTPLSGAAGYFGILNQLTGRVPVVICTAEALKYQPAHAISEIRSPLILPIRMHFQILQSLMPIMFLVVWTAMNRMVLQMSTCLEQR
jgi:hypothetical protein